MTCAMPPTRMKDEAMQAPVMTTERHSDGAEGDVVLRVDNLSLDFRLRTQILQAVRGVSFNLHRDKTLCWLAKAARENSWPPAPCCTSSTRTAP